MALTRLTDHAEQGELLLLDQYHDKPRLRGLLLSYLNRVQELEDAIWDTLVKRLIDNAEDAQLDTIGRIVGEERMGRDDDLYRIRITARIAMNKSHSHPGDIIRVLKIVEGATFRFWEFYPAAILIEYIDALSGPAQDLRDIAKGAAGAGVRVDLVYSDEHDHDESFVLCLAGDEDENGETQGLALEDLSTGGYLSLEVT